MLNIQLWKWYLLHNSATYVHCLTLDKDGVLPKSKKQHINDSDLLDFLKGCEHEVFAVCSDGNGYFRSIAFVKTLDEHLEAMSKSNTQLKVKATATAF